MDKLSLLENRYRPITNTIGFLECSAERASRTFWEWRNRTYNREGRTLNVARFDVAGIAQALELLTPLTTRINRWLFIDTQVGWCAYLNNSWRGPDPSHISPLASRCNCRGMRVTSTFADKATGEMHACIWEVYNSSAGDDRRTERAVWAMDDGGHWDFGTIGEPYPFEQTDRYHLASKRDRFTREMLADYLRHFNIDAFDEAFYRSNSGCIAYLVHIEGPPFPGNEEHTFLM